MNETDTELLRCAFAIGMSACAGETSAELLLADRSKAELEHVFCAAKYLEGKCGLAVSLTKSGDAPALVFRWEAERSASLTDAMVRALTLQQKAPPGGTAQEAQPVPEAAEQEAAEQFFLRILDQMRTEGRRRFRIPRLTLYEKVPEGSLREAGFQTALECACGKRNAECQYVENRDCFRIRWKGEEDEIS